MQTRPLISLNVATAAYNVCTVTIFINYYTNTYHNMLVDSMKRSVNLNFPIMGTLII